MHMNRATIIFSTERRARWQYHETVYTRLANENKAPLLPQMAMTPAAMRSTSCELLKAPPIALQQQQKNAFNDSWLEKARAFPLGFAIRSAIGGMFIDKFTG